MFWSNLFYKYYNEVDKISELPLRGESHVTRTISSRARRLLRRFLLLLSIMPTYKLFYFPAKGAGEAVRLLFAHKGIQYEDIRLSGESWQAEKPNTPFGVMPVLEEDGKKLGGSHVMLRYLAEKPEINLAGADAWENAQIANIADFIKDFISEMVKVYYEKDETRKAELKKRMNEEVIPKYFGKLNEMAATTGYLHGGRLTWPDLNTFCIADRLVGGHPDILKPFPGLVKLMENIKADPGMSKWLAERPVTEN